VRRFLNGLVLGIVVGAAGFWFVQNKARQHPEAEQRYEAAATQAGASARDTAQLVSDAMKAKLETLDLGADEIKDELARTGKIVRRKARDLGAQVADSAADARIDAAIKAKFAEDKDLSVWKISVSADRGHVILSGTVSAPGDIAKAVALALDTDGVSDVTYTLEVKPNG